MERLSFKKFILLKEEVVPATPAITPVQPGEGSGGSYLYRGAPVRSAEEKALMNSKASHIMPGGSAVEKFKDLQYWGSKAGRYGISMWRGINAARDTIRELMRSGRVRSKTHTRYDVVTEALSRKHAPLYVFDFDNTIANTNSGVLIRHKETGDLIQRLSSAEFARYRPQRNQVADFSEFSKVRGAVAIPQIQKIMGNMARKGRPYTVLTARPQSSSKEILKYLKQQGLHTKGVRIIGLGTSNPRAKADYLRGVLSKGKNTKLEFWDDHHENVKHVSKLVGEFPSINIRARHIAYGETQ